MHRFFILYLYILYTQEATREASATCVLLRPLLTSLINLQFKIYIKQSNNHTKTQAITLEEKNKANPIEEHILILQHHHRTHEAEPPHVSWSIQNQK